jgi:catalase
MAHSLLILAASLGLVAATGCPYGHSSAATEQEKLVKRASEVAPQRFIDQFTVNDTGTYLTSDVGGPIEDQNSLRGQIMGA